jgi:hypothetical protein
MSLDARPTFEEPDPDLVSNLRLEVREAYRPGRWMWQIVDSRDGTVFERQFEFDFEGDARRSGLARLAEMIPPLPGAKIGGRTAGSRPTSRRVIVSRAQESIYADLLRLFHENGAVDVIRDRRRFDRRTTDRRVRQDARSMLEGEASASSSVI